MTVFQIAEIATLQKLELCKSKPDLSHACVLKYYNIHMNLHCVKIFLNIQVKGNFLLLLRSDHLFTYSTKTYSTYNFASKTLIDWSRGTKNEKPRGRTVEHTALQQRRSKLTCKIYVNCTVRSLF